MTAIRNSQDIDPKRTKHGDKESSLPDWQTAQIKEAHGVFKRILDPLMLFSELLAAYEESEGSPDFTPAEIAAALRLLTLGGYADLMTFGASRYTYGEPLKSMIEEWLDCTNKCEGGAV